MCVRGASSFFPSTRLSQSRRPFDERPCPAETGGRARLLHLLRTLSNDNFWFFWLRTYILPPLLSPFASPPPIFISIIKNQLVYRPFFVFKFLPLSYLFQPTPNANNNINGIQKKKGNEEKNKIK